MTMTNKNDSLVTHFYDFTRQATPPPSSIAFTKNPIMGREIGLPGFLIGVLTGSALSSLLLTYGRRHEGGDDCKSGNPAAESLEQRSPNPSRCPADHQDELSEEPTETRCFEGPLNDTDGRNHRRNDSESSSIGSLSRRSFALDDDDEASLSNLSRHNKLYAENPDTGTHVQIITPQEWATDEMLAQLSREFDEQILNKLRSREDVEMALRRTRAVNALAHALTVAKDETACFEVASRLLVPHFKIDVCAFLLLKVRGNWLTYRRRLFILGIPPALIKTHLTFLVCRIPKPS